MTKQQKRLARHVTVGSKTYGPGDDIPDEIAAKIKSPKAWIPVDETVPTPAERGNVGTTSGARLAKTVTVGGRNYGPDDVLTDEIARQIRNPKAWEGGKLPTLAKATSDKDSAPAADGKPATETGQAGPADKAPATGTDQGGSADTTGTDADTTATGTQGGSTETGPAAPADTAGQAPADDAPRAPAASKKKS